MSVFLWEICCEIQPLSCHYYENISDSLEMITLFCLRTCAVDGKTCAASDTVTQTVIKHVISFFIYIFLTLENIPCHLVAGNCHINGACDLQQLVCDSFGKAGLVSLQHYISVQSLPFSCSADTRQVSSSLTMEASRPDPGKIILSPHHITQISQRYHPAPQEAMSWNSTHEHVTLTPVKHLRYLIFNGRCYLHLTQW